MNKFKMLMILASFMTIGSKGFATSCDEPIEGSNNMSTRGSLITDPDAATTLTYMFQYGSEDNIIDFIADYLNRPGCPVSIFDRDPHHQSFKDYATRYEGKAKALEWVLKQEEEERSSSKKMTDIKDFISDEKINLLFCKADQKIIEYIKTYLAYHGSVNDIVGSNSEYNMPGHSWLSWSLLSWKPDVIRWIVQNGGDKGYLKTIRMHPIHLIFSHNNQNQWEDILDLFLDNNAIHLRDDSGNTVLHLVTHNQFLSSEQKFKMCSTLLSLGCDPHAVNNAGYNALDYFVVKSGESHLSQDNIFLQNLVGLFVGVDVQLNSQNPGGFIQVIQSVLAQTEPSDKKEDSFAERIKALSAARLKITERQNASDLKADNASSSATGDDEVTVPSMTGK